MKIFKSDLLLIDKQIWMHRYAATIFRVNKRFTKVVFYVSTKGITLE